MLDPNAQTRRGDLEMLERWVHDLKELNPQWRRIAFLEIETRLFRFALAMSVTTSKLQVHKTEIHMMEAGVLKRAERPALFIAQHYMESLTAEQINELVGLQPNYAVALFKKAMGVTMIDSLTQHRVSHAERLFVTTDEK